MCGGAGGLNQHRIIVKPNAGVRTGLLSPDTCILLACVYYFQNALNNQCWLYADNCVACMGYQFLGFPGVVGSHEKVLFKMVASVSKTQSGFKQCHHL